MLPYDVLLQPERRDATADERFGTLTSEGLHSFAWTAEKGTSVRLISRTSPPTGTRLRLRWRLRLVSGADVLNRIYVGWMTGDNYRRVAVKHFSDGEWLEFDLQPEDAALRLAMGWEAAAPFDGRIELALVHGSAGSIAIEVSDAMIAWSAQEELPTTAELRHDVMRHAHAFQAYTELAHVNSNVRFDAADAILIKKHGITTLGGQYRLPLDAWGQPRDTLEAPEARYLFHSWVHIRTLLSGYRANGDAEMLFLARHFALEWIASNWLQPPSDIKFAYYDHGTADRLLTLGLLLQEVIKVDAACSTITELTNFAVAQLRLLQCPSFTGFHQVSRYHNHSLNQASALYFFSQAFPSLDTEGRCRRIGLSRLLAQARGLVSSNGVFVENSPGYHVAGYLWLSAIAQGASVFSQDTQEDLAPLRHMTTRMRAFTEAISAGQGVLPAIGDTQRTTNPATLTILGAYDRPSPIADYADDGFVVLSDVVPRTEGPALLQIVFHATSSSTTHKHEDDLAFTLRWAGIEWFGDPGYPTYNDSALLDIARAASAHSVLDLGLPYTCRLGHSWLEAPVSIDSDAWLLIGAHEAFLGWRVERQLQWDPATRILLIRDRAFSLDTSPESSPAAATLRFCLSEGITPRQEGRGFRLWRAGIAGPFVQPGDHAFQIESAPLFVQRTKISGSVLVCKIPQTSMGFINTTALRFDSAVLHDAPRIP